jgi:hypothetical protein
MDDRGNTCETFIWRQMAYSIDEFFAEEASLDESRAEEASFECGLLK